MTSANLDKVKDEELDAILVQSIHSMDLVKNGEANAKQLMKDRKAAGLEEIAPRPEIELPNIPSCDGCGKDYSGRLRCSSCECAYYCGKECQKTAWKEGHKKECSSMKERAQTVGKSVVDSLKDESSLPIARVQGLTDNLNASGPYMYAVEYGLHDAMHSCFMEDEHIIEHFLHPSSYFHICYTHWIMMCLFRGQRLSRTNSSFGKVDGGRIQAYLQAFPQDGLQVWWRAALQTAMLILDDAFEGHKLFEYHQNARDVWSGFALTFASKRASEGILLTHDKTKCRERATWMLTTLQTCLARLQKAPQGRDHNDVIEAYFNQVAAMIVTQCRLLADVDIDAPKLLKLKKIQLAMYRRIAVPLAEEMIRKKRLNNDAVAEKVLKKAIRK